MSVRRARSLRQAATEAEKRLWSALRDRRLGGLKFRRQQSVGPYVVDFICFDRRLIVEADGGQHTAEIDAPRTAYLERQGFRVIRFWNTDILSNLNVVQETIPAATEGRC